MQEKIGLIGPSSSIVVFLVNSDNLQLYTVLVSQPRVSCGKIILEFPSGMVDESFDYSNVAIRELSEECGIKAIESELINITSLFYGPEEQYPAYSYPSLFDDCEYTYGLIRRMSTAEINLLEGKKFGAEEDEQITLHIVPFFDVWKISQDTVTISIAEMCYKLIHEKKIIF